MVYVAIREQEEMPVHSKKQAQVGALLFNEASTKVLAEYSNYSNVFSAECDDPQPIFSLSHIRADDPHRIFC